MLRNPNSLYIRTYRTVCPVWTVGLALRPRADRGFLPRPNSVLVYCSWRLGYGWSLKLRAWRRCPEALRLDRFANLHRSCAERFIDDCERRENIIYDLIHQFTCSTTETMSPECWSTCLVSNRFGSDQRTERSMGERLKSYEINKRGFLRWVCTLTGLRIGACAMSTGE